MQKRKTGIFALVAALCVVLSVALCGVVARAEGEGNTLTVVATNSTDEDFKQDVKSADVVVDVYKVADAVEDDTYDTYNYVNWDSAFASLEADYNAIAQNRESTAEAWQELYAAAAEAAKKATPVVQAQELADGQAEVALADDGLYLVLAHGKDDADYAYSKTYKYAFPPTMVSMPTKTNADGEMTNPIYTDTAAGEWLHKATILLKSSREPLFGDLKITKSVADYGGEPTTFVFKVTGTSPQGDAVEEYGAISFPQQTETTIEHLPAGTAVTVSEVYEGGRYEQVSGDQDATIAYGEDAVATVTFTNQPNGNHPDGAHGIENHFTYNTETGDWDLTPRSADQQ